MRILNIPGTHAVFTNLNMAFLLVFLVCLDRSASNSTSFTEGHVKPLNHLDDVSQNLKNTSILDTDTTAQLLNMETSTKVAPSTSSEKTHKGFGILTVENYGSSPSSIITNVFNLSIENTPETTQAISETQGNGTKTSFVCSNVTLKVSEFHVPSNDVHIKHLKLKLSNFTRSGETVTVCRPVVEDKIVVRYPSSVGVLLTVFIYAFFSILCAWTFLTSAPRFFALFIASNIYTYFLICVMLTGSVTEVLVYFIPFHLNFMFFLVSGWVTLLSCKVVLMRLKFHGVFRIVDGNIVVDPFHISHLTMIFSMFMPMLTFLGIKPYMMGNTENIIQNMYFKLMVQFTPCIIFLLLAVMCVDVVFTSQRKRIINVNVRHADNYLMFFCYHMFSVVAWVFGFLVVGLCSVFPQFWHLYLIVSVLLPVTFLKDVVLTSRVKFLLHVEREGKNEDVFRVRVQQV